MSSACMCGDAQNAVPAPGVCRVYPGQKTPDDGDWQPPARPCLVCGALIAQGEARITILTGAGGQVCMDCKRPYAFKAVGKNELYQFVSDRLARLSRAQLLRAALWAAPEPEYIGWFYSGGYVETQGQDFV